MIGIDTNILIRYVVGDCEEQTHKAATILESCTDDDPGYVNAIVLSEFVWVLERCYKYSRTQISIVLEKLLATRELEFEHASAAWYATHAYGANKAGFVDLFIGRINRLHGCATTKTFDRNASVTSDFEA